MEKKLYRVKVVLFVMAENELAARVAATFASLSIFESAARKQKMLTRNGTTLPRATPTMIVPAVRSSPTSKLRVREPAP